MFSRAEPRIELLQQVELFQGGVRRGQRAERGGHVSRTTRFRSVPMNSSAVCQSTSRHSPHCFNIGRVRRASEFRAS
jgi:hypothetical protein